VLLWNFAVGYKKKATKMSSQKKTRSVKKIIAVTKFYRLLQLLNRKNVIILMYHGFFTETREKSIEQCANRWCSIQRFEEQVKHLKQNYEVISLERLIEHYTNDKDIPPNSVIITMDDGYKSNYLLAYPILKKYRIPVTIFLTTNFIEHKQYLWVDRLEHAIWTAKCDTIAFKLDNQNYEYKIDNECAKLVSVQEIRSRLTSLSPDEVESVIHEIEEKTNSDTRNNRSLSTIQLPLEWDEIEDMLKHNLVSIGSHSVTHPNLTKCTKEQLRYEIIESRKNIERRVGTKCTFFCYPFGKYNNRVKKFVENAGYSCGVAIKGSFENQTKTDRFELSRIGVGRTMNMQDFIFKLCDIRNKN
jgi:peptidoglycan/xylan/chitin deacetylase (PgdA/CDA1 family)